MQFTTQRKYELESFISDWHWNQESHAFAQELGAFLFGFMDYLVQSGASERSYRTHSGNVWCIGYLTSEYGCYKKFSPDIFKWPPFHDIEYKRKVRDTANALKSYSATCNKLSKYATGRLYETLEPVEFDLLDQIQDFTIGLQFLRPSSLGPKKENALNLVQEVQIMRKSCFHILDEVKDREFLLKSMDICMENLDKIALKLESPHSEDHYHTLKIIEYLLADVRELKGLVLKRRMTV